MNDVDKERFTRLMSAASAIALWRADELYPEKASTAEADLDELYGLLAWAERRLLRDVAAGRLPK